MDFTYILLGIFGSIGYYFIIDKSAENKHRKKYKKHIKSDEEKLIEVKNCLDKINKK